MPAQVVHARVSLPDGTTFEDTASIGMTFKASGSASTIAPGDMTAALLSFFSATHSGAKVSDYLSPQINRTTGGITITYTDVTNHLDGTPAGTPFAVDVLTMPASPSGAIQWPLPAQLAVVCAFRSNYSVDPEHGASATLPTADSAIDAGAPTTHSGLTRPRARDRSRLYLGPLSAAALEAPYDSAPWVQAGQVYGAGTPSLNAQLTILQALNDLVKFHNLGAANEFQGVQWSRRNAAVKTITNIAVDAAVGVIRKRADTLATRVLSWVGVT